MNPLKRIDEKPVLFAVAAAVVISAGTLATTFIPLFSPATQPVEAYVKPYTAIETEGRDIYIREGCNNCHTQTVRPLVSEVARYGEYSRPEESAWDRPHLWGSRRTGPDLAREGVRKTAGWNYAHTVAPQAMFPESNMPAYRWLAGARLDTSSTARKMAVLGYGNDPAAVAGELEAFRAALASGAAPGAKERAKVVPAAVAGEITELDALVAYLGKLGRDLKGLRDGERVASAAPARAAGKNPFVGDAAAEREGEAIYRAECEGCHGAGGKGDVGPPLAGTGEDGEAFDAVASGKGGGEMPAYASTLGEEKIWKVLAHLRRLPPGKG
jgi:cytochrome c oxidase cbb3-type subunit 2